MEEQITNLFFKNSLLLLTIANNLSYSQYIINQQQTCQNADAPGKHYPLYCLARLLPHSAKPLRKNPEKTPSSSSFRQIGPGRSARHVLLGVICAKF
jgi:hypothetical protein